MTADFLWRRSLWSLWSSGKGFTLENELPQFRNADPLDWIALKDSPQDAFKLRRDRQDGGKEMGVLQKSPECGIINRGPFPGVPAASQVDQDDT